MNSASLTHQGLHAIWAVILAAGKSSRMGTSKALLEVGGSTFLDLIIRSIRVAEIDRAVVAISNDDNKIINNISLSDVGVVYNAVYSNMGAIGSIRSAINSTVNHNVEFLMVWPVDHPRIRQETVKAIVYAALYFRRAVTVPVFNGRRGHPVVFSAETFGDLLSPGADGGARAVLQQAPDRVYQVAVDDPGVVANIDTPSDYQSLINTWKP